MINKNFKGRVTKDSNPTARPAHARKEYFLSVHYHVLLDLSAGIDRGPQEFYYGIC